MESIDASLIPLEQVWKRGFRSRTGATLRCLRLSGTLWAAAQDGAMDNGCVISETSPPTLLISLQVSALINHPGERLSTVWHVCQGPTPRCTPADCHRAGRRPLAERRPRNYSVFRPQREDIGRMSPEFHQMKSILRRYQIMMQASKSN